MGMTGHISLDKDIINFCMFTLYTVNLLNSLISSKMVFFLEDSLGFSMYAVMSFANGAILFLLFFSYRFQFSFLALLHWLEF